MVTRPENLVSRWPVPLAIFGGLRTCISEKLPADSPAQEPHFENRRCSLGDASGPQVTVIEMSLARPGVGLGTSPRPQH